MKNLIRNLKRPYRGTQEEIIERVERFCKQTNCAYTNLVIGERYVEFTTYSKITYEDLVHKLVREKYSESEEFAILRKAINEKTDEYFIYNAYVEDCKVRAKEFVAEREKALNN